MKSLFAFLTFFGVVAVTSDIVFGANVGAQDVSVELTVFNSSLASGKTQVVGQLVFTNQSQKEVRIADFLVGKSGGEPSNEFFKVFANGKEVAYLGEMAKRAPPDAKDFVVLKPGQKFNGRFDLTKSYAWVNGMAQYSFTYETTNHFSKFPEKLQSNEYKIQMAVLK